jgi:hypothetical protein
MAMKHGDTAWGFRCVGGPPNVYWIFRGNDPDDAANQVQLPGENVVKVSLAEGGVGMTAFDIFFDKYGIPYSSWTDENNKTALAADLNFSISAGTHSRSLKITPETGFIQ